MTYRKTWFSYVLWVIYTMLCVIFLVFAGNYVCASYLSDSFWNTGLSLPVKDLTVQWFGLVMLPAAAVAYGIVRWIAGRIRKKYTGGETAKKIAECIVVWAFLTVGIFLRVMYALDAIQMQKAAENSAQNYVGGIEYFEKAVVTAGGFVEPLSYGGACFYVACLSFILSFLGNKAVSAIILQVFLQAAGLILAYVTTRKLAGRIPAGAVLLYLSCSPAYLEMLKILGPECLFFDLYLLVMLAAASLVKGYCGGRLTKAASLAGALAVGALIGALSYLDLAAFTLLVIMAAAVVGKKKRREDDAANPVSGLDAAVVLMALLSCAAGLCAALGLLSLNRGTSFQGEITAWAAQQIGNSRTFGFRPLYPYSLDMLLFGGLTVMAAFLVFEFFRSGREQNYMLWIFLCIVAAPTPLAVFGVQPFGLLSMYLWGVLAGLGLQNCILGGKTQLMKTLIEEINQATEEILQKTEAERSEEAVLEPKPPETSDIMKPRFLENPLPLPKKHVPRQMDYQYHVEDAKMKYDVEVKEEDDFDI